MTSAMKLPSNQFDHFYRGGNRIGRLRHGPGGPMRPEEWIGSTTTRFGQPEVGLSKVSSGEFLKDLIEAKPQDWLGDAHVNSFGVSTEILVKLLDPDQRLPVHYHPNRKFSDEKLNLGHGKSEAWIILEAPLGAKVGLGFKEEMSVEQVLAMVKAEDSKALLGSIKFLDVKAGDSIFVPAGVPHAIESGTFVLELQEPTDLSILLEWDGFAVDGKKDGHLNLGFETCLQCLRLSPLTVDEYRQIRGSFNYQDKDSQSIFSDIADPFFRANFLADDLVSIESGFGILLILEGDGELKFSNAIDMAVSKGDAIVIPFCAGSWSLVGAKGILSRPPLASFNLNR